MGLVHRLNKIVISVHAATKETYDKIVLNGNYDQLMKNMRYYSYLSANGKLLVLDICFVVNSLNYHEMPQFLEYAKSIGANAFFWEYRVQGYKEHKNYDELAIHLPQHKDHHKLLEVLKNSCFDGLGYEPLHPQLRQLRMQVIG